MPSFTRNFLYKYFLSTIIKHHIDVLSSLSTHRIHLLDQALAPWRLLELALHDDHKALQVDIALIQLQWILANGAMK